MPVRRSPRFCGDRLQGRNGCMSCGAFPPAVAQLSRYQRSQRRGLICHSFRVAKIENSMAAKRPLHSAPEP